MFEQIRSEYQRHERSILNPALWAVLNYRFGVWSLHLKSPPLRWITSKLYGLHAFIILITSGIRINREATIGKDFHLIHSGNTSIHPRSVIGDRCGIQQDVTLGTTVERNGAPILGDDVYVGAGAKILGPVKIGDGARIAANSLVISDVPENTTAIGVPARVMRYTGRKTDPKKEKQTTEPVKSL